MTEDTGKKRRRLIGIGFVLAFLLSTATIIYTGLNVRAPGSHRIETPAAEAAAPQADSSATTDATATSDAADAARADSDAQ
jgi:hypothetical protein